MITFILSILLLVGAYFVYGKIVGRYLDVDPSRKTPAYEILDGDWSSDVCSSDLRIHKRLHALAKVS